MGNGLGAEIGVLVGCGSGNELGAGIGICVGAGIGSKLGTGTGINVGAGIGNDVGDGIGKFVGFAVGAGDVGIAVGTTALQKEYIVWLSWRTVRRHGESIICMGATSKADAVIIID